MFFFHEHNHTEITSKRFYFFQFGLKHRNAVSYIKCFQMFQAEKISKVSISMFLEAARFLCSCRYLGKRIKCWRHEKQKEQKKENSRTPCLGVEMPNKKRSALADGLLRK